MKDARETFRRAAAALCAQLRCEQTVKERETWVATTLGWVHVPYPYAPGIVTGRKAVALLCGEEQGAKGKPKATRATRDHGTRVAVTSGSYREGCQMLKKVTSISLSFETLRRITNDSGLRTQRKLLAGGLESVPGPKWSPPEGAVRVPVTLVASPDGAFFPCVKADLEGRAGRDGGPAKGRNANVATFAKYEFVDGAGRPIFAPGSIHYFVYGEGGEEFGDRLWEQAVREGVEEVARVEFASDGEKELESIFQTHFSGLGNVARVLDAMHACGYVDTLVKALEPNAEKKAAMSERFRKHLVNAGWKDFRKSLEKRYGGDFALKLGDDGKKAWNYLETRADQMDYRNLRRRHMVIGSGMAEVGCKLTVGGRLKGPGMRWRFDNGIRVALLRAAMRSRLEIVA